MKEAQCLVGSEEMFCRAEAPSCTARTRTLLTRYAEARRETPTLKLSKRVDTQLLNYLHVVIVIFFAPGNCRTAPLGEGALFCLRFMRPELNCERLSGGKQPEKLFACLLARALLVARAELRAAGAGACWRAEDPSRCRDDHGRH